MTSTRDKATSEKGAKYAYSFLISTHGLKNAFRINRRVRELLREEKVRRNALPPSERCLDEFDENSGDSTKTKGKLKTKKTKKKSKGLFASLCELFDDKGIDKVTYQEAKKCAKEAKPDSSLSRGHYKWYMKRYNAQKKE
ncbi:hypothetical protein LCGC14_1616410 [marine sediment metagenome]|uniref:Uncharacterized protein n=1 Tax=marine sediment metagenome TaxID=412755 RepID=A0A0F9I6S6_9ZZZZ